MSLLFSGTEIEAIALKQRLAFSPAANQTRLCKGETRMRATLHTAGVTSDILSFMHLSSYSLSCQVSHGKPHADRNKSGDPKPGGAVTDEKRLCEESVSLQSISMDSVERHDAARC